MTESPNPSVDAPCDPRVLVGEKQPLVREGVVHVLREAGFDVVAVAADVEDLVRKAGAHTLDVVVTDIQMPPDHADDGLRAVREIRSLRPSVGVLVLTQSLEDRYALELVGDHAEGVGYLLKDRVGDLASFTEAVRRVASGGAALDPLVVSRLVGRRRAHNRVDQLSPRDREVLALLAEGRSNQGIADSLVVTVSAVERHVTSIFEKLELKPSALDHRRVLAVLRYLQR
jgi:DNA-binding NarL/FixJ family response regulator